ncbi:hypothetical protein, conserved [Trypanosoma cruzi]|uniref:Chromatin assembly factor 1 subunit A dimerization domain-containing protein n=1 Tax=Trypanosoma cruzi (strain CL Brener) TaxID=353153 RepID=Q4DF56_TRYCC|nr:hypothetical protein, conserved [Trypanosoma cruzi]EAN91155.1 hypothetical protein, conserved [Trypanosoma cruzi]|eukprot:XP_813006.1 hypothetical protein [Trypanosoma cruzi strain CL Brener]
MDRLASLLSGMAPGQIEQAVQLLQRYTAAAEANRQTVKGEEAPFLSSPNSDAKTDDAGGVGREVGHPSPVKAERDGLNAPAGGLDAVSSVIALALEQTIRGGSAVAAASGDGSNDDDDDDDISLVALAQKRQREAGKKSPTAAPKKKNKAQNVTAEGKESGNITALEDHERKSQKTDDSGTPSRKGTSSAKAAGSPSSQQQQQKTAIAARGLASFGFVSTIKRTTVTVGDKKKLFTPFVQDRRLVPSALRFWCHDKDAPASQKEPSVPSCVPREEMPMGGQQVIAVDEESSLMHLPVTSCGDNEKAQDAQRQRQFEGAARRYVSFTAMIDDTTNFIDKGTQQEPPLQCPCAYHVSIAAPRAGFRDEVIFCGFYAIGYDPCQSRPPYFGTYNSQDSLNMEELLQLARFDTGKEMPQMSNLDYEYDSGDDWDVVENDEDLGASSSDTEDEEDSDYSSASDTDNDFINDNDDEDDDSDAELQRKMVEERQRRLNRLRHKDKLVPVFSGPFVGIPRLEHPLRECDRMERLACTLDGASFTAMMEQEMRGLGSAAALISLSDANRSGYGGGGTVQTENATAESLDERVLQQRLVAAALRNRRDMLPDEIDAMHAIIAANGKIFPKAIVEALQGQQLCAGVARAEILRTIRRHYELKHKMMVRRPEPWSPTDERLFKKRLRQMAGGSNVNRKGSTNNLTQSASNKDDNNNINNNNSNNFDQERGRDEEEEADDYEDDEDVPLLEIAIKRPRAACEAIEGKNE